MSMMYVETKEYVSPTKKLARFFQRSRDQWKEKCLQAKQRVKRLQTNVVDLQTSRERWKQEAKEAQALIAQLQAELEEQKTASRRG
jgi:hypothetical protein